MTVIMMYLPGVPAIYHIVLTMPNMMLMNVMASRVFRNTKLQVGQFKQSLIGMSALKSTNRRPISTSPIHQGPFQIKNRDDETKANQSTVPIEVKIRVESQEEGYLNEKPEYSGPSLGHAKFQE